MSAARKTLGPPKGLSQTREAVLGQRFDDTPPAETPAEETSTPVAETGTPASYTPPTRSAKKTRPEPPGMTRRTYYLPQAAAQALEDAVADIQKATGGHVPKHEILAALIAAGAARADAVAADLKASLIRDLQGGSS